MPTETEPRYTLTELADLAGVTARTVRYYISQGLLAVDVSPGPGPKYDDTHLARLRLIRRLQAEHQPLAEIRHRLEGLSDDDVLALAEEPQPPPPDSALDYIRNLTSPGHHRSRTRHRRHALAPERIHSRPHRVGGPGPPVPNPSTRARALPVGTHRPRARTSRLHVRRPLSRQTAKQVDRLISIARDLFAKENQP